MINWLMCYYKPSNMKIKIRGNFSPVMALATMQLLIKKKLERDNVVCMDGVKAELEKITKNKVELRDE